MLAKSTSLTYTNFEFGQKVQNSKIMHAVHWIQHRIRMKNQGKLSLCNEKKMIWYQNRFTNFIENFISSPPDNQTRFWYAN